MTPPEGPQQLRAFALGPSTRGGAVTEAGREQGCGRACDSFGTRLPSVVRGVYHPGLLIGLVAAGAAIAILGSLNPTGWTAAHTPPPHSARSR